jgi:hypothetical protein
MMEKLWRLDDRAYESRLGWLMPGGIAWKLGRRSAKPGERAWPYFFGFMDGWFFNAARERTAKERAAQEQDG